MLTVPAFDLGRMLGERHATATPTEAGHFLIDYAEAERVGRWSLRSALVRYAQPQAERASAILELVRRTDAALASHRALLERHPVAVDPDLGRGSDPTAARLWPDARITDLARLDHRCTALIADAVAGYESVSTLTADEHRLIPILGVAVAMDELADALTDWAVDIRRPRPDDLVDSTCRSVEQRLDELGVARESFDPSMVPAGSSRRWRT